MSFASRLLDALGAPTWPAGERAIAAWAQSEGMPGWTNNPLACGTKWPGSHTYNGTGVQSYGTASDGVAATAWSLDHDPYTPIARALRAEATLVTIYQAVNASPWCSRCQGGHYPVDLWSLAGQPGGGTPALPVQPSGAAPQATPNVVTAWGRLQTYSARDFDVQMAQWDALARQAGAV